MAEKSPEVKIVEALEALTLKAIQAADKNFGRYVFKNDQKIEIEVVELLVKTLAFAEQNL